MLHRFCLFLLLSMMILVVRAQDNSMLKGYVKGMTAMQTVDEDGEMALENTLHNRLDYYWYIQDNLTFTVGLRNRIIAGNNVSLIPDYSEYIGRDAGYFDLSWVWADQNSWIGISQLDRLMIDYTIDNFQISIGRQRINWGQTFVWNPNDLFNTYSYFDFDYEEKPGNDAVRMQYYIGNSSKVELSASINIEHEITSVLLYRFNTRGFDIQFLGGMFTESDYVLGGGWAGSIGGGGFSGEITYFHPMENNVEDTSAITATLHYDYTFKNSFNLQFETLYNGFGAKDMSGGLGDVIFMDLSPKNLFPTKVAFFGSSGYDLTPLCRLMLAAMYGPQGNFMYVGPTLSYSMSNTIELAAIGQYFSMDAIEDATGNSLADNGSALFVRLKWSF